ncbi:MAG TPA: hypothetical protein VH253_02210 [Phycisphaerae bacterium]|nr:hypothetical protein [Phycisphaerae bacterium]
MRHRHSAALVASTLAIASLTATVRAGDAPWETAWSQVQAMRDHPALEAPRLSVSPDALASFPQAADQGASSSTPDANSRLMAPTLTLDAPPPASRIHGFADLRFNTAYITPRGLVVEHEGLNVQPLVGLALNVFSGDGPVNSVTLSAGTWGDLASHHPGSDLWNEEDFFTGFDVKFLDKFDAAYTIMAWTFPDVSTKAESDPTTEYNMDLKLSFDDSAYLKDFALHPYVDFFWNFAGASSPVVSDALLGKNDHTFYVEIGGTPSYTLKAMANYPITFSLPTYFSFGDSSFWGETPGPGGQRSNLGVFSMGLKASVPLSFIPSDFGNWNAYVGVTWIHTCNPALSYVNESILSNGEGHERVVGYAGVGFSF